ncbi:melibiose:sodium transporter MelB [Staphylococcus xylosus]|uniref:Melibiose:sodium transporter MelB n=1 Tax=Staphylococcus xylosus TaxID=1288 RepID=A0AAQ0RXY1_STAXY|nr:melibiose:sodium transporter MelB [Staphylococcus xylosus]PKI04701.1 melibiose:sodium transporter MelB [Staphylococcus xylosus]PTI55084.1 melibiose:sodium transporter MelB [Staphylococcus xylosus]PTI55736.1 melibiose:sodium transporter MelB [Staphylococcus xylosus]RIM66660.1 melibiose:sodium transporter MelB [Staphylococcus xylosus]RIM92505.1 melibiose:sodium transporter MelB [Staphylococcus xylosus]
MNRHLTGKQKFAFGFGAIGKDAIFNIVSVFLMFYITDIVGLSPAFVGVMLFVARIWDAINDPIMGMIVDNTRNNFGKFKTWLVIGTLINAVVTVLLFTNFDLSQTAMYIYISIIYISWGMTYTMMDIPYWSWLPNLTHDPREREELSVIPRFFASLAAFTVGTFGLFFIHKLGDIFGGGSDSTGIFVFAIICSLIFIFTIGVTVFKVPEDQEMEKLIGIKVKFKDIGRILFKNKELLAIMGVLLTFNLCLQTLNGSIIYYFKYVVNAEHLFAIFNSMILCEMVGLLLLPRFIKWVGRTAAFNTSIICIIFGLLIILISGYIAPQSMTLVIIGSGILRIGSGFMVGITTVSLADVIDYGEVKFGQRNESIITSTNTFLTKTSQAVAALIVGLGLSILGYTPNEAQSVVTINGLRIMILVSPLVFICLAAFLYHKAFNLKGDFLTDIEKTLQYKRQREFRERIK